MTQRNPMNDRYQDENRKGSTRKSAASAKPKSKAASSVRIQSTEKTPKEKKAERKKERARQNELEHKYYNPPTEEYKRMRRLWWVMLIGAIVLTIVSFVGQQFLPSVAVYVTLALAYVCIIAALYIDFAKCRKLRKQYAAEMQGHKSKEQRAQEKQQKAAERAAKAEAEAGSESEAPKEEKRGLMSRLLSPRSSGDKAKAEEAAEKKSD